MAIIDEIVIRASDGVAPQATASTKSCSCMAVWLIAICSLVYSCSTARGQPLPQPKPPGGVCPSNYYTSGHYCVPQAQARDAIPKVGPTCPSGWYTSGQFCVSQKERR